LLAFAAAATALRASAVKRTGTIRPLATPFGILGRPTFLGFFRLLKASKLLCGYRFNCSVIESQAAWLYRCERLSCLHLRRARWWLRLASL